MSFNDNVELDPLRVRDSRGRGGGRAGGRGPGRGGKVAIGGGAGLLLLLLALFVPGLADDLGLTGNDAGTTHQDPAGPRAVDSCRSGEEADARVDCRILGTVESADAFWKPFLAEYGVQWREPGVELFADRVETGCGVASSDVGPFYCPRDESAYVDTGFFRLLETRFGASGGPLAEEYVVAHEYGHHIQNIVGYLRYAQSADTGPESGAFLEPLTETDLRDALSAAAAVGDDRIQQSTAGRVMPEAFTHGSSEQRMAWFLAGYEAGDLNVCNTLDHPDLDDPAA